MTAPDPLPAVDQAQVDFAVQIAREAGTLTLRHFRRTDLAVESKGDGTPVTVADRAAERLLRERRLEIPNFVHPEVPEGGEDDLPEPEKPSMT